MNKKAANIKKRSKKVSAQRRKRANATIVDVAREAGVSVTTVSNIINNRDGNFKEATKRRVERVIERLSYRPQSGARSLRAAAKHILAMIVVDESESYLLDPFVANVVVGFTRGCNERGYLTVLHGCSRHNLDKMVVLRQISVDGFCLLLSGDKEHRRRTVDFVTGLGNPVALVQETDTKTYASGTRDLCVVRQNDVDGGRQLCEHLLARGCRRILVVLPRLEWPALGARLEGIRNTAARSKQRVRIDTVTCPSEQFQDVFQAIDSNFEMATDHEAIICANDRMAAAVLAVLRHRNLKVPEDVLVTGFNAFEAWRDLTPTLTTITSPAVELGDTSAQVLIERVESGQFTSNDVVLPVHLYQGEST